MPPPPRYLVPYALCVLCVYIFFLNHLITLFLYFSQLSCSDKYISPCGIDKVLCYLNSFQIIGFINGLPLGFLGHEIRALSAIGDPPLFIIIIIRYFLLKEISIWETRRSNPMAIISHFWNSKLSRFKLTRLISAMFIAGIDKLAQLSWPHMLYLLILSIN